MFSDLCGAPNAVASQQQLRKAPAKYRDLQRQSDIVETVFVFAGEMVD